MRKTLIIFTVLFAFAKAYDLLSNYSEPNYEKFESKKDFKNYLREVLPQNFNSYQASIEFIKNGFECFPALSEPDKIVCYREVSITLLCTQYQNVYLIKYKYTSSDSLQINTFINCF
jgi:hypothetical protein